MRFYFFVNPQDLQHQLTQEIAIQCEKNPRFVFGVKHNSTAQDIDVIEFPYRLNGYFWQFHLMMFSGKIAVIIIKTSLNGILIWIIANPKVIRYGTRREANI
jgi:hypothetical protein